MMTPEEARQIVIPVPLPVPSTTLVFPPEEDEEDDGVDWKVETLNCLKLLDECKDMFQLLEQANCKYLLDQYLEDEFTRIRGDLKKLLEEYSLPLKGSAK